MGSLIDAHIAISFCQLVDETNVKPVRRSCSPTSRRDNENFDRARSRSPLEMPSTSATQSTRFGLLSPPTSVGGGSTGRFSSSTPSYHDSDGTPGPSTSRAENNVQRMATAHTIPPISARNTSPSVQMPPPPAPRTWRSEGFGFGHDLKLLSRPFRDTYHADLPSNPSANRARRARKLTATRENNRTSGKHFYYHFGTPE